MMEYLPDQDIFFTFGGSQWPSGGAWSGSAAFFYETNQWAAKSPTPEKAGLSSTCAWNPIAKRLSVIGARGETFDYDPATDTWKSFNAGHMSEEPAANAEFLLKENVMYNIIGPWDPRTVSYEQVFTRNPDGSLVKKMLKTSGEKAWQGFEEGPGLAYAKGFLYGWANGDKVYRLDNLDLVNQTGTWTELDFGGTGPTIDPNQYQGTYGRFRYSPKLDVFVAVNHVDANVWVARPPDTNLSSIKQANLKGINRVQPISAFPNPLYPSTVISYQGQENGSLKIFNPAGKLVKSYATQKGEGKVEWHGKNSRGLRVASGMYMAKYTVNNRIHYLKLFVAR
jgi:hypothetical protein